MQDRARRSAFVHATSVQARVSNLVDTVEAESRVVVCLRRVNLVVNLPVWGFLWAIQALVITNTHCTTISRVTVQPYPGAWTIYPRESRRKGTAV